MLVKRIHIMRMRLTALILTMMFSASLCLVGAHSTQCIDPLCELCEQNVDETAAAFGVNLANNSSTFPVKIPMIAMLPQSSSLVMSGIRLDD